MFLKIKYGIDLKTTCVRHLGLAPPTHTANCGVITPDRSRAALSDRSRAALSDRSRAALSDHPKKKN